MTVDYCKFIQVSGHILAIVSDVQIQCLCSSRLVRPQVHGLWQLTAQAAFFSTSFKKRRFWQKKKKTLYLHRIDNSIHLHIFPQRNDNIHTLHHKIVQKYQCGMNSVINSTLCTYDASECINNVMCDKFKAQILSCICISYWIKLQSKNKLMA